MSKARQLADLGNVYDDGALSNRNLIINGAMQVAQRGTSFSSITVDQYVVDRFVLLLNSIGTYTLSQSSVAPDGFSSSFKIDCTTANASPAAGAYSLLVQNIEAQNLQQLAYGTSSAKDMTLSFWVRSSKTGSFGVVVRQRDNSNKMVSKQVTISAVDTWEYKTMSIPSDTSGVINNDNGTGLDISWWINGGSNFSGGSEMTTWGAEDSTAKYLGNLAIGALTTDEFYITGVQLEVGDTATPFEHRSYGDELLKCQRYYEKREYSGAYQHVSTSTNQDTTTVICDIYFNQQKRVTPTLSGSAAGTWRINAFANDSTAGSVTFNTTELNALRLGAVRASGTHVAREASYINVENVSPYIAYWEADAEL